MKMLADEKRYHKDVYLPKVDLISFWKRIRHLIETDHYIERFEERKEQDLQIPTIELLKSGEVFEVYTLHGNLTKICIRVKNKNKKKRDSCYVVSSRGTLVTVWSADRKDKYGNLDKSKYSLF